MEETKTELQMIKMSEIQSQEVEWLWYPFIPYGKLTVYCILKVPTIAEGNPKSCMKIFPIIADAFGISLSSQQIL